jgi:SAM-dependent methyltransferase
MTRLMRVLEDPRVYRLWQAPFAAAKFAPVQRHGRPSEAKSVLDVGCGPGTNTRFFPSAAYLGLDISPRYVEQARERYGDRFVVADVTRDPIPGEAKFDFVLVNSLLHHLESKDVRELLVRISTRLDENGHVHILDLVMPGSPSISRRLARWDRGDFPRPLNEWERLFTETFDPVVLEPYALPRHRPTLWHMVYFKGRRKT